MRLNTCRRLPVLALPDNCPGAGLDSRELKTCGELPRLAIDPAILQAAGERVDHEPAVIGDNMVATHKMSAVEGHMPMEVVEDEESGEKNPNPRRDREPRNTDNRKTGGAS